MIDYTVIRSRRRTLALRVNDAGDVLVSAPLRLALRDWRPTPVPSRRRKR